MSFPLKTISGGVLPQAALIPSNTVVLFLPGDAIVLVDAYPFKPTTLVLVGSLEKLVSSRFHICEGLSCISNESIVSFSKSK